MRQGLTEPDPSTGGFIREGMRELARKYARFKLRAETKRHDRERHRVLVALGRRAWEEKAGLSGLTDLTEKLSRLEGQAGELASALGALEKEKARLEANREQELTRFRRDRQAVEEKKKPIDTALRAASGRKDEVERAIRQLEARTGAISAELSSLDQKIQAPGADADPKRQVEREAALKKREQLAAEQRRLPEEAEHSRTALPAILGEVSKLAAESEQYRAEIQKIDEAQRAALSELDAALSQARAQIGAKTQETTEVGKAREDLFGQVGLAVYESRSQEPALAEAIGAAAAVDEARAAASTAIQASLAKTAAMPPGTMGKFWGVVLGVICLAVAAGIGADYLWSRRGDRATGGPPTEAQESSQLSIADSILPPARPIPPLSADELVTEGDRHRTVKFYATEKAFRSEGQEDGRPFIIIVRLDQNLVWTLSPANKTYSETPMSFGGGLASLEQRVPQAGCRPQGEEKVGGYLCVKEQCSVTVEGKTYSETRWVATQLGGLVMKHTDGVQTIEIGAVKLGPQDPALFEVPGGYRKSSE